MAGLRALRSTRQAGADASEGELGGLVSES